jgi:hypothetical protein
MTIFNNEYGENGVLFMDPTVLKHLLQKIKRRSVKCAIIVNILINKPRVWGRGYVCVCVCGCLRVCVCVCV